MTTATFIHSDPRSMLITATESARPKKRPKNRKPPNSNISLGVITVNQVFLLSLFVKVLNSHLNLGSCQFLRIYLLTAYLSLKCRASDSTNLLPSFFLAFGSYVEDWINVTSSARGSGSFVYLLLSWPVKPPTESNCSLATPDRQTYTV